MTVIYVDADACPVKEEIYRVAKRHGLDVKVVANSRMWSPDSGSVEMVVVSDWFDAADDWIVEHAETRDIVVTDDIPLAARSLKKGAYVVGSKGREFTEVTIGEALASRELMSQLRDQGHVSGGPAPFEKKDRSRFLQSLENIVRATAK